MAGFSPASQPIGPAESSVDEADVGKVFSYESRSYRRLAPLEEAIVNKQGEASMALSLVLHRVAGFDPWQEVYDSVTPGRPPVASVRSLFTRWAAIRTTSR